MLKQLLFALASLTGLASAHYTFPTLIVNGANTGPQWQNIRRTNSYQNNGPVTSVSSIDFRCYNSATRATAATFNVNAGDRVGFGTNQPISHSSTTNIYMARAPTGVNVTNWDGSGNVWFKVHEVTAITNGGSSITFPSAGQSSIQFTLPANLPAGEYLMRMENIALHSAQGFGGAQFYISCAQLNVQSSGTGTPGPLVAIPGVYSGNEPGIMINIYYPVPQTYVQPGPALWTGN